MTEQEIADRIKSILINEFEVEPAKITPEASLFDDMDLDSIDAVDLVVKIQQETGKRVDPESFKHIRTFGDVIQASVKLINAA